MSLMRAKLVERNVHSKQDNFIQRKTSNIKSVRIVFLSSEEALHFGAVRESVTRKIRHQI
jgi:hypothetical protein